MRVLFANRIDCLEKKGGDTVQMLKTKQYLESNYNVSIQIVLKAEDLRLFPDYDLVHIFNIQTSEQTIDFIKVAKEMRIPIVLSPIYWNLWHSFIIAKSYKFLGCILYKNVFYFEKLGRVIWSYSFKNKNSYLGDVYKKNGRYILDSVNCLLPNSYEEVQTLAVDFDLDDIQTQVLNLKTIAVPNAIECRSSDIVGYDFDATHVLFNVKSYVLVVGRVEPNKNQLGVLLSLLHENKIPIVFVGRSAESGNDAHYYQNLVALAKKRGNVYFIPEVPHEELGLIYKNAAVHVLASFRESPGLVTLEALNYGCKIVFSKSEFCPVEYYKLNDYGSMCNPYDIASIKTAILKELNISRTIDISDFLKFYSYSKAAEITFDAYKKLLTQVSNPN